MTINNHKRVNKAILFEVLLMLVIGVIIYFIAGRAWIYIEDDSPNYLRITSYFGIMPIYPLLIQSLRQIFGNDNLLNILVVFQSLLAVFSTLAFSLYIKKLFNLKSYEVIIVYVMSAMPFCIYLPEYGVTHEVMTEAVSYSLFYIYFIFCISSIYSIKLSNLIWLICMTIVVGLVRSQLVILAFFSGFIVFVSIVWNVSHNNKLKKYSIALAGTVGMIVVAIVANFSASRLYIKKIVPILESNEIASNDYNIEEYIANQINHIPQVNDLVRIKGWYEAEESDEQLFESELEKFIFKEVYKQLDANEYLHQYAQDGLYMWRDLTKDRIPSVTNSVMENNREYILTEYSSTSLLDTKMAVIILKRHFGRALYHFSRICIQSFIASIFFQIESIYLWCHIITLVLYMFFVIGLSKVKAISTDIYKYAICVITFLLVLVIFTNIVFWGMQRYMVYSMGIFYTALYLMYSRIIGDRIRE